MKRRLLRGGRTDDSNASVWYLLSWLEAGFVTTDLVGGRRVILVHADQRLAGLYGSFIVQVLRAGRPVATMEITASRAALPGMVGSPEDLRGIEFLFPDDAAYGELVQEALDQLRKG